MVSDSIKGLNGLQVGTYQSFPLTVESESAKDLHILVVPTMLIQVITHACSSLELVSPP